MSVAAARKNPIFGSLARVKAILLPGSSPIAAGDSCASVECSEQLVEQVYPHPSLLQWVRDNSGILNLYLSNQIGKSSCPFSNEDLEIFLSEPFSDTKYKKYKKHVAEDIGKKEAVFLYLVSDDGHSSSRPTRAKRKLPLAGNKKTGKIVATLLFVLNSEHGVLVKWLRVDPVFQRKRIASFLVAIVFSLHWSVEPEGKLNMYVQFPYVEQHPRPEEEPTRVEKKDSAKQDVKMDTCMLTVECFVFWIAHGLFRYCLPRDQKRYSELAGKDFSADYSVLRSFSSKKVCQFTYQTEARLCDCLPQIVQQVRRVTTLLKEAVSGSGFDFIECP